LIGRCPGLFCSAPNSRPKSTASLCLTRSGTITSLHPKRV